MVDQSIRGETWSYREYASRALPALTSRAKHRSTITASELLAEIGLPASRTLAWPVGAVANEMLRIGDRMGCTVPPLTSLIVNERTGRHAGVYCEEEVPEVLDSVFEFTRWDEVLEWVGLVE